MSERTHRVLFEHAPVALWHVDVDQVAGVASAIADRARLAGAHAWASHLATQPEDARALAAAAVVREANRRARALGPGAGDLAALLAHVPEASASRLLAAMAAGQTAFTHETTWNVGDTRDAGSADGAGHAGGLRVRVSLDLLDDEGRARGLLGVTELPAESAVVAQLERALAAARAELASFLYAASHDLQAPLRMVVGYTDLLKRRYGEAFDERATRYIEQAGEGGRQMRAMLEGLLVLSRVFTRSRTLVAVDLAKLLGDTLLHLRARIADAGARVTLDPLPTLVADPVQLGQVFEQLIDNAIKFRGAEPPAIHVGARREQDAWVLSVADNGIGMDPSRLEAIFLPFQRLHTREEYPGLGLGLTIVAKIAERHGGRAWAASQPGQGATVYVSIPDAAA